MTTTGKRKSSQAALDALPNVSCSSSSSSSSSASSSAHDYFSRRGTLLRSFEHSLEHSHDDTTSSSQPAAPKRPRLLGSPFDLAKRVQARTSKSQSQSRSRAMLIDEDEEGDAGFRASDFECEMAEGDGEGEGEEMGGVSAGARPQRSGLPAGDIFSPRAFRGGRGSICFEFGEGMESVVERSLSGMGVRPTWLLSPEDE